MCWGSHAQAPVETKTSIAIKQAIKEVDAQRHQHHHRSNPENDCSRDCDSHSMHNLCHQADVHKTDGEESQGDCPIVLADDVHQLLKPLHCFPYTFLSEITDDGNPKAVFQLLLPLARYPKISTRYFYFNI